MHLMIGFSTNDIDQILHIWYPPPHFSGAPIVNNFPDQLDKIRLVIVLKLKDFREKKCTYKISF